MLVNNHDPMHLHDEFEIEHTGSCGWHYLESARVGRIQISKLTALPLSVQRNQRRRSHRPDSGRTTVTGQCACSTTARPTDPK